METRYTILPCKYHSESTSCVKTDLSTKITSRRITSSSDATLAPDSVWLSVPFGKLTFAAEGQENSSRYFSRVIHYPGGSASGVTIGRGYDMGNRTQTQVRRDLMASGLSEMHASQIARGAGLRGAEAGRFVREHKDFIPPIPLAAQHDLFTKITAPSYISDIRRIFNKPDVVEKYGRADWDTLPRGIQELVFDLRYRGDYTPETRKLLQASIVSGDSASFYELIRNEDYWLSRGVPASRVAARIAATFSA